MAPVRSCSGTGSALGPPVPAPRCPGRPPLLPPAQLPRAAGSPTASGGVRPSVRPSRARPASLTPSRRRGRSVSPERGAGPEPGDRTEVTLSRVRRAVQCLGRGAVPPCCTVPCCTVPCCAVSRCGVVCRAVLCPAAPSAERNGRARPSQPAPSRERAPARDTARGRYSSARAHGALRGRG